MSKDFTSNAGRTFATLFSGQSSDQIGSINVRKVLEKDILDSQSPSIIGFFLDASDSLGVDSTYQKAALMAATRLINDVNTDNESKAYLQGQISEIADRDSGELQDEAKIALLSWATDSDLSGIAIDDCENFEMRTKAIEKITDKDVLLDVATDADDKQIRQAAKVRIKELQ
ncbi:MAG: hypothetical protein FWE32_05980 [Oscillospiraceae bacterium]|nr:hypothetical protein [Oscillospiraceae bacterium]